MLQSESWRGLKRRGRAESKAVHVSDLPPADASRFVFRLIFM